jgi:cytochrome c biogenesis protein CcmG/thiol:disulfide interchange protein DsbE
MATVLLGALGLVIVVVLLNLPIGGGGASPSGGGSGVIIGSPLLDKPAPEFRLATLDGREVRLSDYRGRPVIVNFWASWCIPCRDEFPLFVGARAEHAGDGLEILGIVHEDSSDAAAAFARQMGAAWPLLLDPDQAAWKAYQGIGVPSTYFIDRQGIVRATSLGPVLSSALPGQLARIL